MRYACLRRCRLRVTAGLIPRRPGVPLRLGGAARHLFIMGARRPQTPAWSLRSCAARAVGRPPRAPAGDGFRWLRRAPIPEFCPPPTRRRPRPRAPAANPARLALAAGGASAPAAPRGAQEAENPNPARRRESLAAWRAPSVKAKPCGWRAQGTRASLDSARPTAGEWPPPGRKSRLGQGAGWPHRWRSRWSRRASLPARRQAACLQQPGTAGARCRPRDARALSHGREPRSCAGSRGGGPAGGLARAPPRQQARPWGGRAP